MKLSVSVPDDLWSDLATGSNSPSQLVQDALRELQRHRRRGEERVVDLEARLASSDPEGDPAAPTVNSVLDRLTEEAADLMDTGYRMGVELAGKLSWLDLEALAEGSRLRDDLIRAVERDGHFLGTGGDLRDVIYQLLSDWQVGLDEDGEAIPSTTLYAGMAAGLADIRVAIRERLRRSSEEEQSNGSNS